MPKQLNNGKVTQALQRAFGFKGRYIPMLDEVIVPVYQISDPLPAEPGRTFICSFDESPNIGETIRYRFVNPLGSGVNIQLTSLSLGSGTPIQPAQAKVFFVDLFFSPSLDPLTTLRQTFNRDQREGVQAAAQFSGESLVTPSVHTQFTQVIIKPDGVTSELAAAPSAQTRQPLLVLAPGTGFDAESTGGEAPDITLIINIQWLEVPTGAGDGGTP